MTLEYVALGNIDPASFSVLVQIKMLCTAFFFRTVLGKKLKKRQMMSLILLAQLAFVSLSLLAPYALFRDYQHIVKHVSPNNNASAYAYSSTN